MVKLERIFEPDSSRHSRYQAKYQIYQRMAPRIAEMAQELSGETRMQG
jgi:hypothetical protein